MPESADQGQQTANRLRVANLKQSRPTSVHLAPGPEIRAGLASDLGALAVKKLRFDGQLIPRGSSGWRLEADLGATVVQSCIVTLEPVTTRIDTTVVRDFVPEERLQQPEPESEIELTEDDMPDPLGDEIDIEAIMFEALSLAMPTYPRKTGVELGEVHYTQDGVAPLTDDDVKPFAGLAALREKMQDKDPDV